MNMKLPLNLGIRAHDLEFNDLTGLIRELQHYQLHHIQFSIKKCFPDLLHDNLDSTAGLADYFGESFQHQQLKVSILGCYVNLSASDPAVRKQALAEFKHDLGLVHNYQAALIGTETGSVGNGYTPANFTEDAYQTMRASIIELVKVAESFGVTMAVEPGLNHPLYTTALAKRLLAEIQSPNLKIILDVANLARTDNYQTMPDVIARALDDLGPNIAAIHLKDFVIRNQKIEVVPVGQGLMDYRPILRFIKEQRPGMYTSLESTRAPEITPAIKLLNNLYEEV